MLVLDAWVNGLLASLPIGMASDCFQSLAMFCLCNGAEHCMVIDRYMSKQEDSHLSTLA